MIRRYFTGCCLYFSQRLDLRFGDMSLHQGGDGDWNRKFGLPPSPLYTFRRGNFILIPDSKI